MSLHNHGCTLDAEVVVVHSPQDLKDAEPTQLVSITSLTLPRRAPMAHADPLLASCTNPYEVPSHLVAVSHVRGTETARGPIT